MLNVAIILICSFSNRVRGGLFSKLPGDAVNACIFGMLTILYPLAIGQGLDIERGIFAGAAMWLGAVVDWGDYIGALAGYLTTSLQGWPPIDKHIEKLKDRPVIWGAAGLALRGLLWGAQLAFVFHSFSFLIAGLMMPVVYGTLCRIFTDQQSKRGWRLSEWTQGGVFGVAFIHALGGF